MATDSHDSDETDVPREEDGLRVVPEGYDPQQVHELLSGYKAQMDRLEQALGSVQAALGASAERLPGEDIAPPDARALQLAADYRPSTMRFDPTPISMRVSPAAAAQAMRPRERHSRLWQRFVLEGAFLVLVVLSLAALQEPKAIILAGAGAAWLIVIVVEVLLARLQTRVVPAAPLQQPVPAPPPAARPEVVALRLSGPQEPAPAQEPLLPEAPVDAVTGPDDVWVVPQEVLIAEPVLDEHEEEGDAEEVQAEVVLEDTLEEVALEDEEVVPEAEAAVEPEPEVEVEVEVEVEAILEPEPITEPELEVEPETIVEPEALLPLVDDLDTEEDASPDLELPTDSWEPLFAAEAEPEPNGSARRRLFGRRAPQPVVQDELAIPPDPELARVTHPLPPVLIDPHTNGNGKRRRRRG